MRLLMTCCLVVMLSGCIGNAMYFGTYTRVGVDASTDGGGIGIKNAALNYSPTKEKGEAFSVLGTSDIDIAVFSDIILSETVATGAAAECAAMKGAVTTRADDFVQNYASTRSKTDGNALLGQVLFGAYSSWSLFDLSLGPATGQGLHFGYKRSVGVKMPVKNGKIGSVFAQITINTSDIDENGDIPKSRINGTRSTHIIATGEAAIIKSAAAAAQLNGNNPDYNGCL